jgi:D-xylose transport system permease protein
MTGITEPAEAREAVELRPGRLLRQIAQGELATVRVVVLLGVIWIIFQSQNDRFLSAENLTNLMLQVTAVGTVSVGVVLVLLLGEIDLSVGAVSGFCAGVMAVLNVKHGWSPELAIVAGLVVGLAIGTFYGFIVTRFGIPSFVVSLAGLLGFQGALLWVLGETGTVNIPDNTITDLANTFFDDSVGWIICAAAIAAFLVSNLLERRRRKAAGLPVGPLAVFAVRTAVVAAGLIVAISILNSDRGVPLAALILIGFCGVFAFITQRTRFGRHIFAVGGNAEAARRAGIRIDRLRTIVFALTSMMAAAGGILAASRLLAVNQSSGASDFLLLAIAGPVIAGTSLFGGRGSVWHALLGALVIGSISNGINLLGLESDVRFMITGAVLLAAVTLDAITRQQRQQAGRAA